MTYFVQDSFAQNIIAPNTVLNPGTAQMTLGPFDCTDFQGARYFFANLAGNPVAIFLQWFDSEDQASSGLNIIGSREIVLNTFASGSGNQASFTHPHMGDWLVVTVVPTAGNVNVQWAAAHRNDNYISWSILGTPGVDDQYLIVPGSHVFAASGTFTAVQNADGIYAGWVAVQMDVTAAAGSGSAWTLDAMDDGGTFNRIASSYLDHAPDGQATARGQVPVLIPPAPIRLTVSNQTGAANTISWAVVPDEWRAR